MAAQRLTSGTRFVWNDAPYEITHVLPKGLVNLESIRDGKVQTVTLDTLVEALFAGRLAFAALGKRAKSTPQLSGGQEVITEYRFAAMDDVPPHLADTARWRLWAITPLLQPRRGARTKKMVNERLHEIRRPSRAALPDELIAIDEALWESLMSHVSVQTLYRWMRDYKRSGEDLRSLVPDHESRGGARKSRLDPRVLTIVDEQIQAAYMRPEHASIAAVRDIIASHIEDLNAQAYSDEQLKVPDRTTIARRIASFDVVDRFAAHHGRQAAQRLYKQYGRSEIPTVPNTIQDWDSTRIDKIVIDAADLLPLGRPVLSIGRDATTRCPGGFGLSFDGDTYRSVADGIYQAILPKDGLCAQYDTANSWPIYGVPQAIRIDNGRAYRNRHLKDACASLGITLMYTPVRTPQYKGGIERLLGTINTGVIHTLPGTTFSGISQRGDYDSVAMSCLSLDELFQVLVIWLVDVYMQSWHRGLEGIPARRWEQHVNSGFEPRLPNSADELRVLLGSVDARVLQHYGIDFAGIIYQNVDDPRLVSLRARYPRQQLKIKYLASDIGHIHIYDPDVREYIPVPALVDPNDYPIEGLSLWKHRIIRAQARQDEGCTNPAALGRARRRIQDIVNDARSRKSNTTRTNSRIARWETNGRSSPPLLAVSGDELDEDPHVSQDPGPLRSKAPVALAVPQQPVGYGKEGGASHSTDGESNTSTLTIQIWDATDIDYASQEDIDADTINDGWDSDYSLSPSRETDKMREV